ncbi:hypothetical protein P7C73_g4763, partial [Tremellales sp. Uapishka_1]
MTFRDLLPRKTFKPKRPTQHSHSNSLTELLLQPQLSRQTTSTSSLMISPPLIHTAVRASFDSTNLPVAGLSDQQMRFLGSSEAVNRAGIPLEELGRGRSRSNSAMSRFTGPEVENAPTESLPTWEDVDGERRRSEARDRRLLAKPIEREEVEGSGEAGASGSRSIRVEVEEAGTEWLEDHGEGAETKAKPNKESREGLTEADQRQVRSEIPDKEARGEDEAVIVKATEGSESKPETAIHFDELRATDESTKQSPRRPPALSIAVTALQPPTFEIEPPTPASAAHTPPV